MAKITSTYREQEPLIVNLTKDTRTQKTISTGSLDILTKWLVVRYKSSGQLVVYAQSTAGLNSALSDATANSDLVKFYGTFSGAVTIPAGVELCGDGAFISELSGTVTNNGILSHCYVSGTLSNNGTTNSVLDSGTSTIINNGRTVLPNGRTVNSQTVYTGTDTIDSAYSHICDSAAALTLTVTDGNYDGEEIKIRNRGAGLVTISGNISEVTAVDFLYTGESIVLEWDSTDTEWQ